MSIFTPSTKVNLDRRLRDGWASDYPASQALQRAAHRTVAPTRPTTTIDVYVADRDRRDNHSGNHDVYVDAVEGLVASLAKDDKVEKILVGGKVVFTKPVCTGGVDEIALKAVTA